jgi:hypothetical protein
MTKPITFDLSDAPDVIWADPIEALRPWLVSAADENGEQYGRCPLHDDRSPSLGINFEKDVWNCHAGCGGGPIGSLVQRIGEGAVVHPGGSAGAAGAPARLPVPRSTAHLRRTVDRARRAPEGDQHAARALQHHRDDGHLREPVAVAGRAPERRAGRRVPRG